MQPLFEHLCTEVEEQQPCWKAARDGQTIGFKHADAADLAIALHVDRITPPSIVVRLPRPLADLGKANPYPHLPMFWEARYDVQGWNVYLDSEIPDLAPAVTIAAQYNRPCHPVT